jgi:hypothetical protein
MQVKMQRRNGGQWWIGRGFSQISVKTHTNPSSSFKSVKRSPWQKALEPDEDTEQLECLYIADRDAK